MALDGGFVLLNAEGVVVGGGGLALEMFNAMSAQQTSILATMGTSAKFILAYNATIANALAPVIVTHITTYGKASFDVGANKVAGITVSSPGGTVNVPIV